ncbi:MAG: hypothetical protein SFU56_20420 [Capsulimonadales bacterium]|nr:hypothetical protein [Capsulimonadales bacterium]
MQNRGDKKYGPLPLVVGITGHRDLRPEDTAKLEAQVAALFAELEAAYPHTPLHILSPLAEGADRLVARIALARGVRLIVPLPMVQAEYEKDFSTSESLEEFRSLLARADRSLELPYLPGNDAGNVCDAACRAEQYALVGAYVVRHCQILIALWNGVSRGEGGGTGTILEYRHEGIPERLLATLLETESASGSTLDPPETGPVYHIVTPRRHHPELKGEPFTLNRYYPGKKVTDEEEGEAIPESQATFDRIFANMEEFNRNVLRAEADPDLSAKLRRNAGYLIADETAATLDPALRTLRQAYALTDTLAQEYQQRTFGMLKLLIGIVFLAGVAFELSAKLAPDNARLGLIFPGMIGVAWVLWYSTVSRGAWQDRYQDYRALAEGLRVEFFWRLAGIGTSVADNYLRKQRGELDWIRIAIRNLSENAGAEGTAPLGTAEHLGYVQKHWVADQARYFERATHREESRLERLEEAIQVLIATSPVVALLTALAELIPSPVQDWMHGYPLAHKLLIIAVFLLAALAGALHTYVDKRALSEHARQYERMGHLFVLAEHRLHRRLAAGEYEEARQLLTELGQESLAENGDWVMTHRERPVDVPHGG